MAPNPIAAVRRAARAEKAAEKIRSQAEQEWRQTWWATTDALAAVSSSPREVAAQAVQAVRETLGQSRTWVSERRRCGQWFSSLEANERSGLVPRFAVAAVRANVDPHTAVDLIFQAEHEDVGLREFNQLVSGKSWTKVPENMTSEDRLRVARTELRHRPHEVLRDDEVSEAVDEALLDRRISRDRTRMAQVQEEQEARMARFDKNASRAFGLPEVPVQHLLAAAGEIDSALVARDIHGLQDEEAWKAAIVKIQQHLELAKHSGAWSKADREAARAMGLNL